MMMKAYYRAWISMKVRLVINYLIIFIHLEGAMSNVAAENSISEGLFVWKSNILVLIIVDISQVPGEERRNSIGFDENEMDKGKNMNFQTII